MDVQKAGNTALRNIGDQAIEAGKLGCIILAGGQGTRVGASVPKGTLSVSVSGKSCFQLFCEKTLAASHRAGRDLPLAIMTSQQNHEQTWQFLKQNRWFGLKPEQVFLFQQNSLPFRDDAGRIITDSAGQVAEGPDGNGGVFKRFCEEGIWNRWKKTGVDYVHIIPIDNPLANPYDAELLGLHISQANEVSIKTVFRESPDEKVGVIVESEGKIRVIEYFESPPQSDQFANINQFCFSMSFIQKASSHELPLHRAHKKWRDMMVWKTETFLFDHLPFATRVGLILYPREQCYAPLKNGSGDRSAETVKQALQNLDRSVYTAISGLAAPERSFELDQAFYYPTKELLEKWKARALPSLEYICP